MFYLILFLVVAGALFLIFRDDHDDSYNKSTKAPKPAQTQPKPQPLAQPKPQAQPKPRPEKEPARYRPENVRRVTPAAAAAPPEPMRNHDDTPDLSFLDHIDYDEDLVGNADTFDINGLRHHCSMYDAGKIVGIVKPDPSNWHDPRAKAVIRHDGKLLGYIPRTQLDVYEAFNEENVPCPFVGVIEYDTSTRQLIGEIKVIIPTSREYVEEEIEDGL